MTVRSWADGKAMATARNLFQVNCAQCHGSDGGGAKGFPNLADREWQWGGDPDTVVQTIMAGRLAAMPPWSQVLGAQGVDQVVAYVLQLSGQQSDATLAAAANAVRTVCAACHGVSRKATPCWGPNLTDDEWLYGRRRDDQADGRERTHGQMSAFGDRLGAERVRRGPGRSLSEAGS
jgi:cytochrome c oxidase cbb3-type subunit 3